MVSIPVQCSQKSPVHLREHPQPPTGTTHDSRAQGGFDLLSRNAGTFSDLLAEDMSKLGVNVRCQRKEDRKMEHKAPPVSAAVSSGWHGASSSVSKNPKQDPPVGGRMLQTARVGVLAGQKSQPWAWLLWTVETLQSILGSYHALPHKLFCVVLASSVFVLDDEDR